MAYLLQRIDPRDGAIFWRSESYWGAYFWTANPRRATHYPSRVAADAAALPCETVVSLPAAYGCPVVS